MAVAGIPDYHGHDHYVSSSIFSYIPYFCFTDNSFFGELLQAHPKYKYSYGVNDKHTGDYKTAHGEYLFIQKSPIFQPI